MSTIPGCLLDLLDAAVLLLDAELEVLEPVSAPARHLLGRSELAGLSLREALDGVLQPMAIDAAVQLASTCAAAAGDSAGPAAMHELLVARNPGRARWLDLRLQPLAEGQPARLVLTLTDVTESRRRIQELEQLRAAHELALSVLRAEPHPLQLFLDTAEASMALVSSVLRMPARSDSAFRDKLERIVEELRSLGSSAATLGLRALGQAVHEVVEPLTQLQQRSELSGDALLPLATRFDELHQQLLAVAAVERSRSSVQSPDARPTVRDGAAAVRALVTRLAAEHQREVSLVLSGLEEVPAPYRGSVQNMLAQLLPNAIEHGIEPAGQRVAAGKRPEGTVIVEFASEGARGFELMVQDDGQGFDVERIARLAVERGLLTAEAAARTEQRKLVGLVFRAGFSTAGQKEPDYGPREDAARGLGMEFLREMVTRLGGSISVSTKRGRYTRFRVALPPREAVEALPPRVA